MLYSASGRELAEASELSTVAIWVAVGSWFHAVVVVVAEMANAGVTRTVAKARTALREEHLNFFMLF